MNAETDKAQHTAGLLSINSSGVRIIEPHGICIAECFDRGTETPDVKAIAKRLVACWNALEGIPDPASAVPALVGALEGVLIDIHNQRTGWGDTQFLKMAEARIRNALAQGGKR